VKTSRLNAGRADFSLNRPQHVRQRVIGEGGKAGRNDRCAGQIAALVDVPAEKWQ